MEAFRQLRGLFVHVNACRVWRDVSLRVMRGEVFGVLGPMPGHLAAMLVETIFRGIAAKPAEAASKPSERKRRCRRLIRLS